MEIIYMLWSCGSGMLEFIKNKKKWIISLLVILVLCGVRFTDPWFLDMVRMKALDQHQRNQTQQSLSNLVTIEINNETLKKKGQWPWDRNTLSLPNLSSSAKRIGRTTSAAPA